MIAVVSLGHQRVTIYDRNGVVTQSPISSGQRGHETPEGVFSLIEKKEHHFSNLYDAAEMPFMQRITWSGVALHAGALPGYPASHGCIRMPHGFAERLFSMTRLNMRVVVTPHDGVPMSIAHPALFQPTPIELEVSADGQPRLATSRAAEPAATAVPRTDALPSGVDQPMMLGGRLAKPVSPEATDTSARPQRTVVSAPEASRILKSAMLDKAQAALKAAEVAKQTQKAKLAEIAKSQRDAKIAEVAERRARGSLASAERQIASIRTEEQMEKVGLLYAKFQAEADAAKQVMDDAKALAVIRQAEIKTALASAKAAEDAQAAAQKEVSIAERLAEPISVLVSRQTGKLYVRQGRAPVFEAPVTLKDDAKPIGTHVFTAIASEGDQLSWNVVTVQAPAGEAMVMAQPVKVQKGRQAVSKPAAPPSDVLGNAALERLDIPAPVLARITPYIQPGSSLIISDLGPSVETGPGTDFVVQTKGEEEAIATIEKWKHEQAAAKAGERWALDKQAERAEMAERVKERIAERTGQPYEPRGDRRRYRDDDEREERYYRRRSYSPSWFW